MPPPKPPNPDEETTLWQGITNGILFAPQAFPTALYAFGLPIFEAAYNGLPVIATNWSAYLDFMNLGRFVSIDYDLIPIHQSRQDSNIFMYSVKNLNIM